MFFLFLSRAPQKTQELTTNDQTITGYELPIFFAKKQRLSYNCLVLLVKCLTQTILAKCNAVMKRLVSRQIYHMEHILQTIPVRKKMIIIQSIDLIENFDF